MVKRTKTLAAAIICLAAAAMLALAGCGVSYDKDKEDMSLQRSFGESSTISCSYSLLGLYNKGPYILKITPEGFEKLGETDYVVVSYTVLENNEQGGREVDFATCSTALNLLTDSLGEVGYGTWNIMQNGVLEKADAYRLTLDVGKTYKFYIPLSSSLEKSRLGYITVSDREGFYSRTGNTYYYKVTIPGQSTF